MFLTETLTRIAACSLCIVMAGSCLTKNFSEETPSLSLDVETLEIPGDLESGEIVSGTVTVSSNRSWNAEIVPAVDWVQMIGMKVSIFYYLHLSSVFARVWGVTYLFLCL